MDNPSEQSVSQWLVDLQSNESTEAQQEIWTRYFSRLVGLAHAQLGDAPRGAEDEEDVAVSALESFFSGMQEGHFPDLRDRNALWPLLAKITTRKAINQRKRQMAAKRGGGRVVPASAAGGDPDGEAVAMDFVERGPTPSSLIAINEECKRLIALLPEPELREIARLKLCDYTTAEIAERVGMAPRTVERKTSLIRKFWIKDSEESAPSA